MNSLKSIAIIIILLLFYLNPQNSFSQTTNITHQIIDTDSKLELLFDGGFFTEGPAMGPDGNIYFSDITFTEYSGMQAGHLWKYDPISNETSIYRSPSGMSNGIIFDHEGNMIVALMADFGGRCIIRTNMSTGKSEIIAGTYKGKSFNAPNDLAIDERGRIYFTDPRYVGHEPMEQSVMGVYKINLDGSVERIIENAGTPNGILVSPDQKTLYVASLNGSSLLTELNALMQYQLDEAGNVSNEKIFLDFKGEGGPDGMAIDINGNLYLARKGTTPGIYIYSPEGMQLGIIHTPEGPTNVAFGHGESKNVLFITAGVSLYKIKVNAEGYTAVKW